MGSELFLCMHEDLSSNLQYLHKSQAWLHMSMTSALEDGDRKIVGACFQLSSTLSIPEE